MPWRFRSYGNTHLSSSHFIDSQHICAVNDIEVELGDIVHGNIRTRWRGQELKEGKQSSDIRQPAVRKVQSRSVTTKF